MKRVMPRSLSFLLALSLSLLAAPAHAQPADPGPSPAAQAFAEGTEAYRRGDYPAALEAFNRSYKLQPRFLTLCSIARCHEHSGRLVQAAGFYRRCLGEGAEASPKAEQIKQALHAVELQLGRISVRATRGVATAVIDGKVVGRTPVEVAVEPGPHQVQLQLEEASSEIVTVEARAGKQQVVLLSLPESATAVASQPASRPQPPPQPTRKKVHGAWLWTTVGLTVAFAVTSAVLGAKTMDANHDYETNPTKEGYDRVILRRNLTNVFFALALGGVATSGVLLYFNRFGITVDSHDQAGVTGRRYDVMITGGGRF
jgi:hypothetical protein